MGILTLFHFLYLALCVAVYAFITQINYFPTANGYCIFSESNKKPQLLNNEKLNGNLKMS